MVRFEMTRLLDRCDRIVSRLFQIRDCPYDGDLPQGNSKPLFEPFVHYRIRALTGSMSKHAGLLNRLRTMETFHL